MATGWGSHAARLTYPRLPAVYSSRRHLLDRIRSIRNVAQYDAAGTVSPAVAARAIELAEEAVLASGRRLG